MNKIVSRDEMSLIISTRLRERLDELHMSQRELAEISGVSEVNISRYISRSRLPNAYCLINIAQALDCTVNYLMGY